MSAWDKMEPGVLDALGDGSGPVSPPRSADGVAFATNISIAISLKRIADAMGPRSPSKAEVPAENQWLYPDDVSYLDVMDPHDQIEVSFIDGRPTSTWLLGDAIDWSVKRRRLKLIFGAWRPVCR